METVVAGHRRMGGRPYLRGLGTNGDTGHLVGVEQQGCPCSGPRGKPLKADRSGFKFPMCWLSDQVNFPGALCATGIMMSTQRTVVRSPWGNGQEGQAFSMFLGGGTGGMNGDGRGLDLGWWTQNTVCRWCVVKSCTWNLCTFVNLCPPPHYIQ